MPFPLDPNAPRPPTATGHAALVNRNARHARDRRTLPLIPARTLARTIRELEAHANGKVR